ncbi:MAG: hypothetical protein EZS28_026730, partial [Streblomastix strix]
TPDSDLAELHIQEPIRILAEDENPYRDELTTYEGQDKVLEYECEILSKPEGFHWFKFKKTIWFRDGFISHNVQRGKK